MMKSAFESEPEELLPSLIFLNDAGTYRKIKIRRDVSDIVSRTSLREVLLTVSAANMIYGDHFYLDIHDSGTKVWVVIE